MLALEPVKRCVNGIGIVMTSTSHTRRGAHMSCQVLCFVQRPQKDLLLLRPARCMPSATRIATSFRAHAECSVAVSGYTADMVCVFAGLRHPDPLAFIHADAEL